MKTGVTHKKKIETGRIARERKTIRVMVRMYCRANHDTDTEALCPDCSDTERYAQSRIDSCRFVENKPTCLQCPVHCYSKTHRENIRRIMRFSGPRMLASHPILALLHLIYAAKAGSAGKAENARTT